MRRPAAPGSGKPDSVGSVDKKPAESDADNVEAETVDTEETEGTVQQASMPSTTKHLGSKSFAKGFEHRGCEKFLLAAPTFGPPFGQLLYQ